MGEISGGTELGQGSMAPGPVLAPGNRSAMLAFLSSKLLRVSISSERLLSHIIILNNNIIYVSRHLYRRVIRTVIIIIAPAQYINSEMTGEMTKCVCMMNMSSVSVTATVITIIITLTCTY